jgi:hypothetical protein
MHRVICINRRQAPTNKKAKHVVRGWPARVIAFICLLPIPLAFLVGMVVAAVFTAQGRQVTRDSFFWVGTAIEGSVVAACLVAAAVLSRVYRVPVEPPPEESNT